MRASWSLCLLVAVAGCFRPLDRCEHARPGDRLTCPMPGYTDRAFDVEIPASWNGTSPLPVVFAIHGGAGNREAAAKLTCPGGDLGSADCLPAKARARGYAIVMPDGTGTRPLRNLRTWNAGGGHDGWLCVSGGACQSHTDDLRYFDDLFAELARILPVDSARVYATGISNGGAMTHRLACAWDHALAAAAPVGGGNQLAAAGDACRGGTPLLHIHGTLDPCWRYATSDDSCAGLEGGRKIGVEDSMAGWRARNGCSGIAPDEPLPDRDPADGTTSARVRGVGCAADTDLVRVTGGGHTWPGGHQYLNEDTVGRTARDFDADDLILDFFDAHRRP